MLAGNQSPLRSLIFLQAQILSMFNILDQIFFLINYSAPSALFIQCKVTVKCHLIIKGNSMHSFCDGGNTQLCYLQVLCNRDSLNPVISSILDSSALEGLEAALPQVTNLSPFLQFLSDFLPSATPLPPWQISDLTSLSRYQNVIPGKRLFSCF